jgi:ABC-type multidrug transport system fused ATPase/permease subunit
MKFIKSITNLQLWRFGWHFVFALLILIALAASIAALIIGSITQQQTETVAILSLVGSIVFAIALLVGFFAILLLTYENVKSIKDNGEKLDNTVEMITRNRNLLGQIAQGVRLSDAAKEIAFRDTDRMELAEAILAKLHQHDFDATYAMVDAMSRRTQYKDLAEHLRKTTDKYRNATEEERINQIIAHIDKLCQQYHWSQATAVIERLVKTFPESEKTLAMATNLRQRKDKRKRELLAAWDNAVKRQETNRSLKILKELDQYLTPTEGLALQESASSVFRTKLHNLGVQFSLAVSEKRWPTALQTGQQIVQDFPNSRMAHEIRNKMDILHERAKPQ